jgi:F0F1-type ATP synthase gamma subunit
MKLVAATKVRRAKEAIVNSRPFRNSGRSSKEEIPNAKTGMKINNKLFVSLSKKAMLQVR